MTTRPQIDVLPSPKAGHQNNRNKICWSIEPRDHFNNSGDQKLFSGDRLIFCGDQKRIFWWSLNY